MFVVVGAWISPAALAAVALGVTLGLRAAWWAVLLVVAACAVLAAAAVRLLMRWSDAHAARVWSQRPAQLHAAAAREVPAGLPPAGAPAAVEQHVHYEIHYHEVPAIARPPRQPPGAGPRHISTAIRHPEGGR